MRRLIIAAALLACATTSNAVPVLHDIVFTPSIVNGGPAGVGTLSWDSETYSLTNVNWDFGEGRTGGIQDIILGIELQGFTWGAYLFEQMTGIDLLPPPDFFTFSFGHIFGPFPNSVANFGENGTSTYVLYSQSGMVAQGTLTVSARRGVPEPGTWALVAVGIAGVLLARRRVATTR